jgi:2'-5' RNA ligase
MRCFVAIDIEDDIRYDIAELQEGLKDFDVKLVEMNNLHFTLKFLGELDNDMVAAVKQKLENIANNSTQFEISLHGMGVFPSMNYIKVVWVGDENKDLYNLQKNIEEDFAGMFKKEEPSPHLTIVRVRTPVHKKEIAEFVEHNKHIWLGKMLVKEIKLKRSYLSPKGPKYEDLATFGLSA